MKNQITPHVKTFISAIALTAAIPVASAMEHGDKQQDTMASALKATTVEGMDLIGQNGEEIGSVRDIVFNAKTGEIDALVVGTGFLGIGGDQYKIKLSELESPEPRPYELKTKLGSNALENAPKFSEEQLERSGTREGTWRTGQFSAISLLEADVQNENGSHYGEVHDWVVDIHNGHIAFVIARQPDPIENTRMNYFAIGADRIRGVENGDLVVSIDGGDYIDAPMIDDETPLTRVDDPNSVYEFRYDPDQVVSQR